MSVRQLLLAWGMAGLLVIGLSIGINALAARAQAQAFAQADIVVIGSSLMGFAVPLESTGPDSLLGDGRSHRRFVLPAITEDETLNLFEQALDRRRSLIFVEANTFLFDFANAQNNSRLGRMQAVLRLPGQRFRDAVHGLDGQGIFSAHADPAWMKAVQSINKTEVAKRYPLTPHAPRTLSRLTRLAQRANRQGATVVLILPPRSAYAAARIGPGAAETLQASSRTLAARLNFKLFAPSAAWSNTEFIDAAHMNGLGQRHFLDELRRWWAQAS